MSEDKPIFKLKKVSKKVGDFDVTDNTTEWIMLEKQEVNDLPSFIHLQRLWIREETEDVVDGDGNIISRGFKKSSSFMIYKGFIKDEKYIVETRVPFSYGNNHDAQQSLIKRLRQLIDFDYKMVVYIGEPTYYANERQPIILQDLRSMTGNLVQSTSQIEAHSSSVLKTLNTIKYSP